MPGKVLISLKRTSTLITLLIFGLESTFCLWLLQPPSMAHANRLLADQPGPIFTVNSTEDNSLDTECSDDYCTLRGAITAANNVVGDTTILFSIGNNQMITLTSMLPSINPSAGMLTIDGETHSPTINGNNLYRGFTVSDHVQFTLAHVTISNGSYTGGDCTFMACGGGIKIQSGAQVDLNGVVILNSSATGSGGAIYNEGTATLTHVTIQNNSSEEGGGIVNSGGTLNISKSVFSGNTAKYGGGILLISGAMNVENSTFSGNTSTGTNSMGGGGAIDQYNGGSSFNFCTFTNNTAVSPNQAKSGIWLENGTMTVQNSIISNNNGANNLYRSGGTFTSGGYNIADAWNGVAPILTDLTGDPKLKSLIDNGGHTFTHALEKDSPAVNAANPAACLFTDQRDLARVSGACDIGAYELQSEPTDISLSAGSVVENAAVNTVVGTLSTTDADSGDTFTYTLVSGTGSTDNGSFNISGNSLRTSSVFDYETQSSYSIRVRSTDKSGLNVEKQFTITVIRPTPMPFTSTPTPLPSTPTPFTSTPSPSNWTAELTSNKVVHGDPAGTLVGTVVSSVAGTTYKLIDTTDFPHNSVFKLSSGGALTLAVKANRNLRDNYPIRIQAAAPDGRTLTINVVIKVMKDGNEAGARAKDDTVEVVEGGVIEVDVQRNDRMSNGADFWKSLEIIQYPGHGTAYIGSIIYTPDSGYIGKDSITYRTCDNLDYCVVGKLTLIVGTFNDKNIPQSGFSPNRMTFLPEYPASPVYSETGGVDLSIPSLDIQASVVGVPITTTGWDVAWLGNQVGWLEGSAFPTANGNSVLTGHVFNADGKPGIFIDINKLRWGDEVIIQVGDHSYVYAVREVIDSVDPSDVSTLMEHREKPWLTLFTCKGYDEETSTYQWRYLVRAVLIGIE